MTTQPYVMILGDFAYRIPQQVYWYESFDLGRLCGRFRERGWFPLVTHYEDPYLLEQIVDLEVAAVLPATSMLDEYRQLVLSVCGVLETIGAKLIPNLASLTAHENKLLQVLTAKAKGIAMPRSAAVATYEATVRAAEAIGFPIVLKLPGGSGSQGVRKIDGVKELESFLDACATAKEVGTRGMRPLVVQEYLPNLDHDWKVLLFGDRASALRRRVRQGDFRASGSGLLDWVEPPAEILDFARDTRLALGIPWASLDIVQTKDGPRLIEHQAVHFGMTTCLKADSHYVRQPSGQWRRESGPLLAEEAMADEVVAIVEATHGAAAPARAS